MYEQFILCPLSQMQEYLPKDRFCRCHNSFIVNLFHIRRVSSRTICLTDGRDLSIGRRYMEQFQGQFVGISIKTEAKGARPFWIKMRRLPMGDAAFCLQRAYGGLFFGQQLQSRHHGEAGVIIADSQYAAVLLGDGSHLQRPKPWSAGILLCGA